MKELLRTDDRQKNYLTALRIAVITISKARQILESNPNLTVKIDLQDPEDPEFIVDPEEFLTMLNGAAVGFYNELAHPLIENGDNPKYLRTTDEKMKVMALQIIDQARKDH